MKYTVTIEIEENLEEELSLLAKRHRYQEFHDDLYDKVFRPVIKYGTDEKEIECFHKILEAIQQFSEDTIK